MEAQRIKLRALDPADKQEVKYCIPLWLRDEQMKASISRIPGRVEPVAEINDEPCAVVCYGPSLNETWEKVRDFETIFSCSGAHKFLTERGIIPTYHTEVDPRAHKAKLIGQPNSAVQYLIASCCHKEVFDLLEGFNVKLWHVFANDKDRTFPEMFPRGDWAMTGGSSVGLRSMMMARLLGFRNLHIFGMDGSFPTGQKHAAAHPNQSPDECIVPYDGKEYRSTPSFLECAKQTFHELDMMPDITPTFYGEGLCQHMARNYIPRPVAQSIIAFNCPETISAEYRALNEQLHRDNLAYGVGGSKHAATVQELANNIKTRSVLDYGCGKGHLAKSLPWPIWEYDPAVPGKTETPRPADLVICTDVLEHIEPEKLDFVLDDLRRCVRRIGYFVIHTGPSGKTLADGRNSHLIQEGAAWWLARLRQYFDVPAKGLFERGPLLYVVVAPQPKQQKLAA